MKQFIESHEREFTDKKVAKLLASKVYGIQATDEDFAVQIFIETLVLPKNKTYYSENEMIEYITRFIDNRKQHP